MLNDVMELSQRRPEVFTIQYPPGRGYFQERYRSPLNADLFGKLDNILLYLHIPFCKARCSYCNFAIDTRKDQSVHQRYIKALISQLAQLAEFIPPDCRISGIDIGGGTPTLITTELLDMLIEALAPWKKRSIVLGPLSVETTPGFAAQEPDKIRKLAAHGVDRISMGIQSTSRELLAKLNRNSVSDEKAVDNLLNSNFRRINIDLIFGLPGQDESCWEKDVRKVTAMGVDSVTIYDCLYRGEGRMLPNKQPRVEQYGKLYDTAYEILTASGYHAPYGSVNFSKHLGETGTSPYFEGRLLDGVPYIGLGNYASSLVGHQWWFAPYTVNDWENAARKSVFPVQDSFYLPDKELMAKYILCSLNFGFLDPGRFSRIFHQDFEVVYKTSLEYLLVNKWIEFRNGCYFIASGSFNRMWAIRALFYPESAIEWVAQHYS